MLKSFLYAVLKVYIYIRSDWYEPVTFFVYIENCISYYTKSSGRNAEVRVMQLHDAHLAARMPRHS